VLWWQRVGPVRSFSIGAFRRPTVDPIQELWSRCVQIHCSTP
jgi:hypothetical protein